MPNLDSTGPRGFGRRLGRPRIPRCVNFNPQVNFFKPVGIPLTQLKQISLLADELEAIKLHDVDDLNQLKAAEKMKISQPTFARILDSAYKKIASALINGLAIQLEN